MLSGRTGWNPEFGPWTAPSQVMEGDRPAVVKAVIDALNARDSTLANGLTRLPNSSTAVVKSYGNAGVVDERGVELGAGTALTRVVSVGAAYSRSLAAR